MNFDTHTQGLLHRMSKGGYRIVTVGEFKINENVTLYSMKFFGEHETIHVTGKNPAMVVGQALSMAHEYHRQRRDEKAAREKVEAELSARE